jgi:hypothetical protein
MLKRRFNLLSENPFSGIKANNKRSISRAENIALAEVPI